MKSIYQLFVRGENANNIYPYGTGVGLYVTKQFVDMLSGKIEINSVVNAGTEVTVTLPIKNY